MTQTLKAVAPIVARWRRAGSLRSNSPVLTPAQADAVMFHFLRLRQACCHPQVAGGSIVSRAAEKQALPMPMILQRMEQAAVIDVEAAFREVVACVNGRAGIALLKGQVDDATAKYVFLLREVATHKGLFRMDALVSGRCAHCWSPCV